MTRRVLRAAVALALVAIAAGSAAAAAAAPVSACASGGVTVVVDFGTLPGGVQTACVTGAVTSGLDALQKAGFSWTGAQRFPGLVCRIDGAPATDPCVTAPPADHYWSYWTAARPGAAWVYSDQGAGTRTPPAGSVDGWAFVDGCDRTPGSGPCASATTTTTARAATTTTAASPASTTGPAAGTGATSTISPAVVGPGAVAGTSTTGDGATAPPAPTPTAPEAATGDAAAEVAVSDTGPGSPAGALLGGAAALLVGTSAAVLARRRRLEGHR